MDFSIFVKKKGGGGARKRHHPVATHSLRKQFFPLPTERFNYRYINS